MISSVVWLPQGAAAARPAQFQPSAEEVDMARAQAGISAEAVSAVEAPAAEAKSAGAVSEPKDGGDDELPADLNMDAYDDSDDEAASAQVGGTVFENIADDPYMEVENEDELDSDHEEDTVIKDTDTVFLAAHAEDEYSCLEVYVYDPLAGNLYVHHDIALPAFPLALAWMDQRPGSSPNAGSSDSGSFVAVATFEPAIEIWNLDVLEVLEPVSTLGGRETAAEAARRIAKKKKKKGKRNAKKQLLPGFKKHSHEDAVLSLSWNAQQRHILASGSADKTVKIWDVATGACVTTLKHHTDKVQAVQWHPAEPTVIVTGAYDRVVSVQDVRQPNSRTTFATSCDVECIKWNPHNMATFAVTTEDGNLTLHDARNASSPVFTLNAHSESLTACDFSPRAPGLLATTSTDKTVKLWDIHSGSPSCVASKSMGIGELFCLSFSHEDPWLLVCGGEGGKVAVWETSEQSAVERTFGRRVGQPSAAAPQDVGVKVE